MKQGNRISWLVRVLKGVVVAGLAAAVALIAVVVISGRWQIQPVLSGSMRPGLPIGGVVVAQRVPVASLRARDVVIFHPPGHPTETYVHRITALTRTSSGTVISTQGDANVAPDPWRSSLEGVNAYQARFSIPLIGYVAVWYHSATGRRALLSVAAVLAALLIGSVGLDATRRRSRQGREKDPARDEGNGPQWDPADVGPHPA